MRTSVLAQAEFHRREQALYPFLYAYCAGFVKVYHHQGRCRLSACRLGSGQTDPQTETGSLCRRQQFKDLVYLGIDEFSLRKGHKYMTIFMNLNTGRIIHAVEGRAAEIVAPFLKLLAKKPVNSK
jgi:hypothetical protein